MTDKAAILHAEQAVADYDRGNLDSCIGHWREALQAVPDAEDWHHNLAVALASAGRHAEATEEFQKALQSNPEAYDSQMGLALSLGEEGWWQESIPAYRRAQQLRPGTRAVHKGLIWAANGLAQKTQRAEDWQYVLDVIAHAAQECPDSGRWEDVRILTLWNMGCRRKATQELERLVPIAPTFERYARLSRYQLRTRRWLGLWRTTWAWWPMVMRRVDQRGQGDDVSEVV